MGVLFSLFLPADYDLLSNRQISSRTSPGLLDIIAAMATGLAGAVALARKDVAAVLPDVAIATLLSDRQRAVPDFVGITVTST